MNGESMAETVSSAQDARPPEAAMYTAMASTTRHPERPPMDSAIGELRHAANELSAKLDGLSLQDMSTAEWHEVAASIGRHMAALDTSVKLAYEGFDLESPQNRILDYLKLHVGEVVGKDQLRGVAAIHEWARRIRELRVEQGWPILSSTTSVTLTPGQYLLEGLQPDEALAQRWRRAKTIRNQGGSGKNRGLELLKALSPAPADKEQLAYVMKIKSYARRIRELDEEGWQVESNIDNAALPAGSYRLVSFERRPPRVRRAVKLRHRILGRDGWRCQDCRRTPDDDHVTLKVHHVRPVSRAGDDDPSNLVTLCSDDHAGRHAMARGATSDDLVGRWR
jgi:hypothetical protein